MPPLSTPFLIYPSEREVFPLLLKDTTITCQCHDCSTIIKGYCWYCCNFLLRYFFYYYCLLPLFWINPHYFTTSATIRVRLLFFFPTITRSLSTIFLTADVVSFCRCLWSYYCCFYCYSVSTTRCCHFTAASCDDVIYPDETLHTHTEEDIWNIDFTLCCWFDWLISFVFPY